MNFWNPGQFSGSFFTPPGIPILDQVTGAAAAYSLRKLSSTYAGSAIRIRRSSDNAEQDIGFSSGDLDTAAITSFVGSNSAYVTKWYDQSGNGRDAVQATAANQPRVVNTGTIDSQNGLPAIFNTTSNGLSAPTSLTITDNATINAVLNYSNAAIGRLLDKNQSVEYTLVLNNPQPKAQLADSTTSGDFTGFSGYGIFTTTWDKTAQTIAYFGNGSAAGTGSRSTSFATSTNPLIIFNRFDMLRPLLGYCSELIIWQSTLSSSNRLLLERNQGSHYAISVA